MEYPKITTFDEAKSYFKTLWRSMESVCVLKNLKQILNFLQSPAEELGFVNMQEKYLPFYYMIILDEEFLQTTFLTDECKVVANEIIQTLEANKNCFNWEVSFSRPMAGIPVIFRKVYTNPEQPYVQDKFVKPICSAFKQMWIKRTLKFIKSTCLILKYPEMPRHEAEYLYKGILKLNDEDLVSESLWTPVWEALNIFKVRYDFIISFHPTASEFLKFVHFEKVFIQRSNTAMGPIKPTVPLHITESKLITEAGTNDGKNNASNHIDKVVSVVNHKALVKMLLEMNVTKSGTIVYTLKVNESNKEPVLVNYHTEVQQVSDKDEVTDIQSVESDVKTTESTPDDQIVDDSLTNVVQGEVNTTSVLLLSNVIPTIENDVSLSQEDTVLTDNTINCQQININCGVKGELKTKNIQKTDSNANAPNENVEQSQDITNSTDDVNKYLNDSIINGVTPELESFKNNHEDVIDASENISKVEMNLDSNEVLKNESDSKKAVETTTDDNPRKSEDTKSEFHKSNNIIDLESHDDVIVVDDDNTPVIDISDTEMESASENPFIQQTSKMQNQRPLFLKQNDFIPSDEDTDDGIDDEHRDIRSINPAFEWNNNSEIFRTLHNKPQIETPGTKMSKAQRRFEKRISRKKNLLSAVRTSFITTSFKAIIEFINDDSRATMDVVGLDNPQLNVLSKLHGFAPKVVPTERVFNERCVEIAKQLFRSLNECDFNLEVKWLNKPNVMLRKIATHDPFHDRTVQFRKGPFKKTKNNKRLIAQTPAVRKFKDLEELRKPKSILETCLMSPVRNRTSRSPSASSARTSVSPGARKEPPKIHKEPPKIHKEVFKPLDEADKPRTSVSKVSGGSSVEMKAKLMEGLAVPLESDKAMRMMRLMGWKGGALGVRGEGIIEPIRPQLGVPRGLGLGHQRYKSSTSNINRLQRQMRLKNEEKHDATDHQKIGNVVPTETGAKDKIESSWLTNESLLEKIHDRSNGKTRAGDKSKDILKDKEVNVQRSDEMIGSNDGDEMEVNNESEWRVAGDEILPSYIEEPNSRYWTNRIQFLVHLLEFLQRDDKTNTLLYYVRKPNLECIAFIASVVCSLNQREGRSSLAREGEIMEACAREIKAHPHLHIFHLFRKRRLALVKTDGSTDCDLKQAASDFSEFQFETTHSVGNFHTYPQMPQGAAGLLRSKMITNRIVLEFVKSGDEARVYYFAKTPQEIRNYIIALISMLNRQVVDYQLGLGRSELAVYRETLHWMKNTCLNFRFDTHQSSFSKLQLVKVDFNKRCCVCQLTNQLETDQAVNHNESADEPIVDDDIELYPNRFVNQNDTNYETDKDVTIDKSSDLIKFTNDNDNIDCSDEFKSREECLVGEDWLYSDGNASIVEDIDGESRNIEASTVLSTEINEVYEHREENHKQNTDTTNKNINKDADYEYDKSIKCNTVEQFEDNTNNISKFNVISNEQESFKEISENVTNFDKIPTFAKDIKENSEFEIKDIYASIVEDIDGELENIEASTVLSTEIDEVSEHRKENHKQNTDNTTNKIIKKYEDTDYKYDETIKSNTVEQFEDNTNNISKFNVISNEQESFKEISENVTNLDENSVENAKETLEYNTEEIYASIVDDVSQRELTNTEASDVFIDEIDKTIKNTEDKNKEDKDKQTTDNTNNTTQNTEHIKPVTDIKHWPKNILIVHYNYPNDEIDATSAMTLQSLIYDAINKERYLPHLKCHGLRDGGIIYTCYDHKSYIWLFDHLLWSYTILEYNKVLDVTHKIRMKVNTFIPINVEDIFANIEKFYDHIKTGSWNVIRCETFTNCFIINVLIDDYSLENIKKENFSLFIGFDKADINVIYD